MNASFDLDAVLAGYRGRGREALLPVLWQVQGACGTISPEHVQRISHSLRVPEADIYGVIGFYTLFHDQPTGQRIIRVCGDPSCALRGADAVLHGLCQRLGIGEGETTPDGAYTLEHSPCLGLCDHAPAALASQQGQSDMALPRVTVDLPAGRLERSLFHARRRCQLGHAAAELDRGAPKPGTIMAITLPCAGH